jgi:hypothetical protein
MADRHCGDANYARNLSAHDFQSRGLFMCSKIVVVGKDIICQMRPVWGISIVAVPCSKQKEKKSVEPSLTKTSREKNTRIESNRKKNENTQRWYTRNVQTPELESEFMSRAQPILIQTHATHYAAKARPKPLPKEKTPKIVQSTHMVGAMLCTKQTVDASASKDSAYEDAPLVRETAP